MAISKRRITAVEFEAIRPLLQHISQERVEAARAALVDGTVHQVIAAPHGWTRQAVNDAVTAVWKILQGYREGQSKSSNLGLLLPPGWEQVTLIAPSALIAKFRADIALYARSENLGRKKKKTR
jgi:hypothetical protein